LGALRLAILASVIAAALALVAGCGGGDGGGSTVPVEGPGIGTTRLELADCTSWKASSVDDRLDTLRRLREFAGGPIVGGGSNPASGSGAVLDDDKAYDLLDGYCKNDWARAFKLYKLYERAAAFSGEPAQ
jgi:hypothetical protein